LLKEKLSEAWKYRIVIAGILIFAIALLFYLLLQSIIFYSLFYSYFLITPNVERFSVPLYFNNYDFNFMSATAQLANGNITNGQEYDVYTTLNLPESINNFDIGMFMVKFNIDICKNQLLDCCPTFSSTRNAILRYKSFLHRTFSTLFFIAPLIFDYTEESQKIIIQNFEQISFSLQDDSVHVNVSITNNKLQLYDAKITFIANLKGLSYICYYWFYTSAFIGTAIIFTLSLFWTFVFTLLLSFQCRHRIALLLN